MQEPLLLPWWIIWQDFEFLQQNDVRWHRNMQGTCKNSVSGAYWIGLHRCWNHIYYQVVTSTSLIDIYIAFMNCILSRRLDCSGKCKKRVIATAAPQVVSQITFNMINLSSQFHQDVPTCDCFIENNLPPLKDRPSVVGGIPISTGPLVGGTRPTKLPTSKLNQLRSRYKQKHGNTWGVSHRLKTFSSYRVVTDSTYFTYDKSLKARGSCFCFLDESAVLPELSCGIFQFYKQELCQIGSMKCASWLLPFSIRSCLFIPAYHFSSRPAKVTKPMLWFAPAKVGWGMGWHKPQTLLGKWLKFNEPQ